MSDKYTLNVLNNSTQSGVFCVFQEAPDVNVPNIVTLAWLAKPAHPTTQLKFKWSLDYSFIWSNETDLQKGTQVVTSQVKEANLHTLNQIDFDYDGGAYTFKNSGQGDYEGNLYIDESQRVQSDGASVGIGMSGKGTFLVKSQPNMQIMMTPKPAYWLAFGYFQEGEILDIAEVTQSAYRLEYKGVDNMNVELTAENNWKPIEVI